jgi:hypothetical protein
MLRGGFVGPQSLLGRLWRAAPVPASGEPVELRGRLQAPIYLLMIDESGCPLFPQRYAHKDVNWWPD